MNKISFSLRRIAKNWADKPDSAAIFTDAADEIESLAERIAELEEIIDGRYEKHMAMIQRIAEMQSSCDTWIKAASLACRDKEKVAAERDKLRDEIGLYKSWMKRKCMMRFGDSVWDSICDDYPYLEEK